MTGRTLDHDATNEARRRHAAGVVRLNEAFGVAVRYVLTESGKKRLLPPPPAVLAVLSISGARTEACPPGHGAKSQKRRSKRRRLRRRERFLQRQTWRAFGEEEKRRAKEAT